MGQVYDAATTISDAKTMHEVSVDDDLDDIHTPVGFGEDETQVTRPYGRPAEEPVAISVAVGDGHPAEKKEKDKKKDKRDGHHAKKQDATSSAVGDGLLALAEDKKKDKEKDKKKDKSYGHHADGHPAEYEKGTRRMASRKRRATGHAAEKPVAISSAVGDGHTAEGKKKDESDGHTAEKEKGVGSY